MLLLRGTETKARLTPVKTHSSAQITLTEFRVSCLPVRSGPSALHNPLSLLRAHPYRSTQPGHWQEPTAKFSSCRSALINIIRVERGSIIATSPGVSRLSFAQLRHPTQSNRAPYARTSLSTSSTASGRLARTSGVHSSRNVHTSWASTAMMSMSSSAGTCAP